MRSGHGHQTMQVLWAIGKNFAYILGDMGSLEDFKRGGPWNDPHFTGTLLTPVLTMDWEEVGGPGSK